METFQQQMTGATYQLVIQKSDDNTQELIKYDQNGNEQWSKYIRKYSEITLCGDNYDNPPRAHSIVQTNDNGFMSGDILGILKLK